MPEEVIVEAVSLAKSYGSLKALDDVDFQVREGEIFGLIGADGAGKTTAFKIIAGVLPQGGGEIRVLGKTPREAGPRVGYLTQPFSLYLDLSVDENLAYAGGLRQVPAADYADRRERYFKLFDLSRFTDRLAGRLSGGMKQKLALARALVHEPKILLLDEPTSGLDPQVAQRVHEFILQLKSEGRTILLCTHNLDEAERLCDRIAVLRTRLVAIDTPQALRHRLFGRRVVVKLRAIDPMLVETVSALAFVRNVARDTDRLFIQVDDPETNNPDLVRKLVEKGADIQSVTEEQRSLSDIYIRLIDENPGESS